MNISKYILVVMSEAGTGDVVLGLIPVAYNLLYGMVDQAAETQPELFGPILEAIMANSDAREALDLQELAEVVEELAVDTTGN